MQKRLSEPSIIRLCLIYRLMEELEHHGVSRVHSSKIGENIGARADSVRKDMSMLGDFGNNLSGYDVSRLKNHIIQKLGLDRDRNACIVGLGKLGSAIINYIQHPGSSIRIVAGFDNNLNKLELIKSPIEVFPAYRIEEIIAHKKIGLAILAVPGDAASKTAARLIECGILGIINFTPVVLTSPKKHVFIRNIDLVTEMRILSALLSLDTGEEGDGISS